MFVNVEVYGQDDQTVNTERRLEEEVLAVLWMFAEAERVRRSCCTVAL